MAWLERIPRGVVRACAVMLPRIDAEESLRDVLRIAVGTASLKEGESRRILDGWRRVVRRPQPLRSSTAAEMERAMAGMGLCLEKVPKA